MAAPAGLSTQRTFPGLRRQRPHPVQVRCRPVSRRPVSRWPGRSAYLAVVAVATLAVVGGLGVLGQVPSTRIPAETAVVRVGTGETLWDVAQRVAPRSDPRAVVERIRQLNGMPGSAIQPGQRLHVPTGR